MKENENNQENKTNINDDNNNNDTNKKISTAPPNKTLFLQNLPKDTTQSEIESLFRIYNGFKKINLIQNKPGIGFAEFQDSYFAGQALTGLNGYNLRNHNISVTYAQ